MRGLLPILGVLVGMPLGLSAMAEIVAWMVRLL